MAGRPQSKKANVEALQRLVLSVDSIVDLRPVIAYTMHHTGATSREIGEVFGVSRQMADIYIEQAQEILA